MRVIRAEVLGMCFGVRDALAVIDGIGDPAAVTIHGQLVHNEIVHSRLAGSRVSRFKDEAERGRSLPETPSVLITAHGISDKERRRLEAGGKQIVDTTCPLVTRVHQAARSLERDGYHVLVIGRRGHVEVEGITEDLEHFDVIESADDVTAYPSARLGIVCQTTATDRHVATIRSAIAARNPDAEIKFIDTVCLPTKEHQRALERLLERVDAVVVVGGRQSNNTRELVARCRESGQAGCSRAVGGRPRSGLVPGFRGGWFDGGNLDAGRDDRRGPSCTRVDRCCQRLGPMRRNIYL